MDIRVEFKPLLSSANVCVEFSRDLAGTPSRVVIENRKIHVECGSKYTDLHLEYLVLKPDTCRGLRWMGGGELHLTLEAEWAGEGSSGDAAKAPDAGTPKYTHVNQEVLVSRIESCQSKCFCVGCGLQIFSPSCHFKRVLPLPSENWSDFADIWFCHNHSHGGGHGEDGGHQAHVHSPPGPGGDTPNNMAAPKDLLPRPDDCLVSSLYMLVSCTQVRPCSVAVVRDKLICQRCSNFLGFVKKSKRPDQRLPTDSILTDVYKVYFHAVCFRQDHNKNLIPKPLIPDSLSSKKGDKSLLSEQSIEEFLCHLLQDQSHRFTSFRFIVDASLQFEGQSGVTILLWLLDQDLVVTSSKPPSPPWSSYCRDPPPSEGHAPCRSIKLLYKADFVANCHKLGGVVPNVFSAWRKDNTVHGISLPYPLCKQLLSLLIASTKALSKSQRSLNSFHVGYLSSS